MKDFFKNKIFGKKDKKDDKGQEGDGNDGDKGDHKKDHGKGDQDNKHTDGHLLQH